MIKNVSLGVIIPVYNRYFSLRDAIESVFLQSIKPSEIIIINDGSSFNYTDYLSSYLPKIRLINLSSNMGVSYARNAGIKASNSEYIAFLDSDDLFLSKKLEYQLNFMLENNYKISHTDEFWYRKDRWVNQCKTNVRYGGFILDKILDKCRVSPSSLMVHKSVFQDFLFNENLKVCEDYEFCLRTACKYEIGYLNKKLIIKRAVEENSLSAGIKHIESIRLDILKNFYKEYEKVISNENKSAVLKEISRKEEIVKSGLIKSLNKK